MPIDLTENPAYVTMKFRDKRGALSISVGRLVLENGRYFAVAAPDRIGSIGEHEKIALEEDGLQELKSPKQDFQLFGYRHNLQTEK